MEAAQRLVDARQGGAFSDAQEMAERACLDRGELGALAAADALQTLSGNRHYSYWQVTGVEKPTLLFPHWRVNPCSIAPARVRKLRRTTIILG
jgi:hypothetical protein